MSSMTRSIKRGILFKDMNKQQKKLWSSMKPEEKRNFQKDLEKDHKHKYDNHDDRDNKEFVK